MDAREKIAFLIEKAMQEAFQDAQVPQGIADLLEVPPDSKMGDYAFPCFRLSKQLRMGPPQIAQKLQEKIDAPQVARAECVGGYLNFFLNRARFAEETLSAVLFSPEKWGSSKEGEGKTVCLDFSSINIAKRFHIGHLSTTVIGSALARIYAFLGWHTVSINHLGDWGTQFGKMIAAYKHWGSDEMIEKGGVQALSDLYVRFHREAEHNPALEDEGRAWFKKIEQGDKEALAIFNRFKEMTLRDAEKVYAVLGTTFDSYNGESFYNDKMGPVIDELREKGLLKESDGAYVVDLEKEGMPPCLILKSDGATLYATRDLAAALYRKKTYHFDKCLYVVAYQQDLHFRQLFAVLDKMGYHWAKDQMEHVAFGMVSYEGEALSTRKGNIIYLDDLLSKAQEKAMTILEEKSPGIEDKKRVARQVGVGAVVFTTLYNNRIKDIDFWWDRALNFDGETGPYVQYTCTRCASVLRKGESIKAAPDYAALDNDEAQQVLLCLSRFPEAVREAQTRNEPYVVTRAAVELAKSYNKFYYEHRILTEDEGASSARLLLTKAVRAVLTTALYLIGVEVPDKM